MKIKKFIIILLIIITISTNSVKAEEMLKTYPDITDEIEIRYKWYKEIISEEGKYYPLKDIKETKAFIDDLRTKNGNLEIALNIRAESEKSL